RNNGSNTHIMRFRAPLFIAEADVENASLLRDSEKVVFPQQNHNGIEARYGNFHCAPFGENAAVVTDSALFAEKGNMRTTVIASLITC
ncbi:MAG: hypothetical protein IKR81_09115, partial [Victivallales bacterium]|nr:hypothetical protein [Victivallales bacterium]